MEIPDHCVACKGLQFEAGSTSLESVGGALADRISEKRTLKQGSWEGEGGKQNRPLLTLKIDVFASCGRRGWLDCCGRVKVAEAAFTNFEATATVEPVPPSAAGKEAHWSEGEAKRLQRTKPY